MNHDIEAAWATSELAFLIKNENEKFFSKRFETEDVSTIAGTDNRKWPVADGIVQFEHPISNSKYNIAVEYKRENEGLHGILTAIGQAHAYLKKGFSAATIVIPKKYTSHSSPGQYIKSVIDLTSNEVPITVFTYEAPHFDHESPFRGKIECLRPIKIDHYEKKPTPSIETRVSTLWGHIRDGSLEFHGFYCYLKTAKELSSVKNKKLKYPVPQKIRNIIGSGNIYNYLSNANGEKFHDLVWKHFWFKHVITKNMLKPWELSKGVYDVNRVFSLIKINDDNYKEFFSKRRDSIKTRMVLKLNNHQINEKDALNEFIKNVRIRAHSYREDIDSSLDALGMISDDGRPTELGYKFLDACDRTGEYSQGVPKMILGSALLNNAKYGALLHYIFKVSDRLFKEDPMHFTTKRNGRFKFDSDDYLLEIRNIFSQELNVMRTVSPRGGQSRKPFQAELAIMRKLNYVSRFRMGVGLIINWPEVQKAINYN